MVNDEFTCSLEAIVKCSSVPSDIKDVLERIFKLSKDFSRALVHNIEISLGQKEKSQEAY